MSAGYLPLSALQAFVVDVLRGVGIAGNDRQVVADALVDADASGVGTHGVRLLPIYVERIRKGLMNPKPILKEQSTTNAVVLIDGDNGLGQISATRGALVSVERAKVSGVAAVAIHNSNHFGAAGYYARLAAQRGALCLVTSNGSPAMAPAGGATPFFPATPLAFAAPTEGSGQNPLVLDMSLAVSARAHIRVKANRDEQIPYGLAIDTDGNPTRNPSAALSGALLPVGEHKGYGMALMLEILTSALSGGPISVDTRDLYDDFSGPQEISHFILALEPRAFGGNDSYERLFASLAAALSRVPAAPGSGGVRVPGQGSGTRRAESESRGVKIDDDTSDELRRTFPASFLTMLGDYV